MQWIMENKPNQTIFIKLINKKYNDDYYQTLINW